MDALAGGGVVFHLQLAIPAAPHLGGIAGIPASKAVIIGAEIADLIAVKGEPCVQFGIGDRLGDLVDGAVRSRIGRSIPVRRGGAGNLAVGRVAIGQVGVDDRGRPGDIAVIGAVAAYFAVIGAGVSRRIKAGSLAGG